MLLDLIVATELAGNAHLVQILQRVFEVVDKAARTLMLLFFSVAFNLVEEALEAGTLLVVGVEDGLAEDVNVAGLRPGGLVNEVLNFFEELVGELREDVLL